MPACGEGALPAHAEGATPVFLHCGPKGQNMKAQGNALGHGHPNPRPALKGRNITSIPGKSLVTFNPISLEIQTELIPKRNGAALVRCARRFLADFLARAL